MKTYDTSIFVIFTGFLIAVARLIFGSISNLSEEFILLVMALVNYIAFGFVILFLCQDIITKFYINLQKAAIMTLQKKRISKIITSFSAVFLILYLSIGLMYIIFLKSSVWNDVISIIALTISIAANGFAKICTPIFYKFVIKLSKIGFKNSK